MGPSFAGMRRLDGTDPDFDLRLGELLARSSEPDPAIETTVREIIRDVRDRGDEALLEYTRRFDRRRVEDAAQLRLPPKRLEEALRRVEPAVAESLRAAAGAIRQYHEHQRERESDWEIDAGDGVRMGQRLIALDRVGLYVPGGRAAYPSSVLMSAIPALVAGVGELVMVVPTPDDELNEAVLAAAAVAGVTTVFTIGGAQAIAALAWGTDTVPAVDKIVGPGNIYVATAKRLVFGRVGIDMVAGPSEVVVVADAEADPEWVAMDLFAQAEHDELAQSLLVTEDPAVADAVDAAVRRLLPSLERHRIIAAALDGQGALITVRDRAQLLEVVNRIAPEHLELAVADPDALLPGIRHAGAVFVGHYSAEVLGDYCAGPNHVLPTAGTARFSSPLGVYDFRKRTSVLRCTPGGGARLAATASVLARAEGLTAHARAAEFRRDGNASS